jgi:hypothetical protein
MFSVLVSYLKFHYFGAYAEGYRFFFDQGYIALVLVGIPLAILWALLPLVIASFFISGLYFIFLWNV